MPKKTRTFNSVTLQQYNNLLRNAQKRENMDKLPFTVSEFREYLQEHSNLLQGAMFPERGFKDILWTCPYSGKKVTLKNISVDHMTPLSRGGRTTLGNLVPCDAIYNKAKGKMTFGEFKLFVDLLKQRFPTDVRNDIIGRLASATSMKAQRVRQFMARRKFQPIGTQEASL